MRKELRIEDKNICGKVRGFCHKFLGMSFCVGLRLERELRRAILDHARQKMGSVLLHVNILEKNVARVKIIDCDKIFFPNISCSETKK